LYKGGTNALQLAVEHSESVELLKNLLQTDSSLTKTAHQFSGLAKPKTPLGFLCGKRAFSLNLFNEMFDCLLSANSSVKVVGDALASCFCYYGISIGGLIALQTWMKCSH
jgi:hypothetical protein